MTVYVDDYRREAQVGTVTGRWSHLVTDPGGDLDELHAFAQRIGLKRGWFQGPPRHRHPHYDVTDIKRRAAIAAGAQAITWRRLGEMLAAARTPTPAAASAPGLIVAPAPAPARSEDERSCSFGFGQCDRTDTRPYMTGPRCPDHAPWLLAGHADPASRRYCVAICYCGECLNRRPGTAPTSPVRPTVVDFRAIASGKRRSQLGEYREAQQQVQRSRTGPAA